MKKNLHVTAVALLALAGECVAAETPAETAAAFGAREGVEQLSLSPDGSKIAFLAPTPSGQGSTLFTVSTAEGASPIAALAVNGRPDRLDACRWVSETRLVCTIYGVIKTPDLARPLSYSRLFAVDAGGGNQRMLTNVQNNRQGAVLYGGGVIDWLPGQDGKIMMMRDYQSTQQLGTLVGSSREGTGVDVIDTRTLARQVAETPKPEAIEFITDGRGTVRIAGYRKMAGRTGQNTGFVEYRYRPAGSRDWNPLSTVDAVNHSTGFDPYAVDSEKNVAYGFRKLDGRLALYTKALDATGTETLVLARPDVDVDGLMRIGRDRHVVGASFTTDKRQHVYFDPAIKAIADQLHRALPKAPIITVVDASLDEKKLLIFAGSDIDAGRYYLFDRAAKRLQILMLKRPQLEERTLAAHRPVTYRAADGTAIPAYLTLPSGGAQKGLPAIVLPHGGPSSRDEWGFDWLPQFFAARGYAVIQPQFRGSAGYGDVFFQQNGFRSWRVAIGDVADAGRWLVKEGIADANKLAILGWSYGGYAALQSAVVDPTLFKAIVAVAPVTDLAALKAEARAFSNARIVADMVGDDPAVIRDGSPAQNAGRIKAPVLLAHGTVDRNVGYGESVLMEARLRAAGGKVELLSFPDLDHYLDDTTARTMLLERSDAFFRAAIGG